MTLKIETDHVPPYGFIDFALLTCDYCTATYPANGLMDELWPTVQYAAQDGWQILEHTNVVCCKDCHLRLFNDPL